VQENEKMMPSIKFLAMIGLTLSAASCHSQSEIAKSSSVKSEAQEALQELGASDLSILVPLQSFVYDDPLTSTFSKVGTGMCNAPTLDLGGDDPILSSALWQGWAKDSLMSVLPLPSNTAVYRESSVLSGLPGLLTTLKADMNALPDVEVPADDLCPEPIGLSDLKVDNIELLRNEGTNVAVTQTLPAGACHYKNWRVVAMRFEPCSFRPSVLAKDASALDSSLHPEFPLDACGGAELRLVLQPFIANEDGGYTAVDLAIHAFYKLSDTQAFVDDLRSLKAVTQSSLNSSLSKDPTSVWYADQKEMLLPHPGLREEMDCLSGADSTGPVGTEWKRLLAKYAKQSQLFKLTWMTSDNSGGNWSFGLRLVQPGVGSGTPRLVTRNESFQVETFTVSQATRGFPYTPFDPTLKSVDYFYKSGRSDLALSSADAKASLKELIDIANPDLTSLNLGGKSGASCASCHTRDQTEKAVRNRMAKTHEELAVMAETSSLSLPIWDPIRKTIERRNDNNLRNFGYGPAMTLGVSRRALNETDAVRRVVKSYFPRPSGNPATQMQSAPAQVEAEAAAPVAINFATDIKPLLEARCGYCHSSKRGPAVLVENTAAAYSSTIVTHICSDTLSRKHMPPGKVLPEKERALILAWANGLYPDEEPMSCESLLGLVSP
jgi:hypothetical protein